MTYAEVTQFGNSEQIHFLESADPVVSDGQLLIEIQSAGINFSDIMARVGVYPDIPRPPFRPGFEVAGRVKSIGKGVKGFSVGDGHESKVVKTPRCEVGAVVSASAQATPLITNERHHIAPGLFQPVRIRS
jgi:NADPH:quinone reductase-like Zn-dependent oxidoreductase